MQFLTLSRRRTERFTEAQFTGLQEEEFARARELLACGCLRHVWRRNDIPGACAVWEVNSEEHLLQLIGTLPLFKAGMLELIALIPLRPYAGFPCPIGVGADSH